MDFTLTEEQRLLKELVERLAFERHPMPVRRAAIAHNDGFHRPFWMDLADAGVLGALLPESSGGLNAGPVAGKLVASALGRHLVNSPWVSCVVCVSSLLSRAGTPAQRQALLPEIAGGRRIVAYADEESGRPAIRTQASPVKGGVLLDGHKPLVTGAAWSDEALVIARAGDGLGAFRVPMHTQGLHVRHHRTIDGGSAGEMTFTSVFVPAEHRIGEGQDLTDVIEAVRDEAIVALCADATGSIGALLEATVEYARTRKQFGKKIGSFQALQHRMVNMLMEREQAESITHRAALELAGDPQARQRVVSAAKALVGKAGRMVAQAAVQIHGGIGTTDELDVSHHFRRIEMLNLRFGSVDEHVQRYAGLLDA